VVVVRLWYAPHCPHCRALLMLLEYLVCREEDCVVVPVMYGEEDRVFRERMYASIPETGGEVDVSSIAAPVLEGSTPVLEVGSGVRVRITGFPPVTWWVDDYIAEKLTGASKDIPKKVREYLDRVVTNLRKLVRLANTLDRNTRAYMKLVFEI